MSRQEALEDERGFTLIELVLVIVLMGIMIGVAMQTYFGILEGRRVDSATNQLVADLRLAHTKATNRFVQQTVEYDPTLTGEISEYTVTGVGTRDLDDKPDKHLVEVAAPFTVVFEANGEAQITAGDNPIEVRSTDDTNKKHTIDINTVTSRIQIDP